MTSAVSTPEFVQAMGLHVSSVCVIATALEGQRFGLTATAISSVCADPPRLLVCVNKSGATHEKIAAAGHFSVNVLSETQDRVAKSFAGMMGRDFDRFSVGEWQAIKTGSPCLNDACAVFDCRTVQTLDQFTHSIILGEVVGTKSWIGREPLLYGSRRFRTLRKQLHSQSSEDIEALHFW